MFIEQTSFKMESTDPKFSNEWSINYKRRSSLLRHYSRKNYEIREKSEFKDERNDVFSEPTHGKIDIIWLFVGILYKLIILYD